jgi:hypothetical protein
MDIMVKPCIDCFFINDCKEGKRMPPCMPYMRWQNIGEGISKCLKGLSELGYGIARYELEKWLKDKEYDE